MTPLLELGFPEGVPLLDGAGAAEGDVALEELLDVGFSEDFAVVLVAAKFCFVDVVNDEAAAFICNRGQLARKWFSEPHSRQRFSLIHRPRRVFEGGLAEAVPAGFSEDVPVPSPLQPPFTLGIR